MLNQKTHMENIDFMNKERAFHVQRVMEQWDKKQQERLDFLKSKKGKKK